MIQAISAITIRVTNMRVSVCFYKDILGLEIIYGGEEAHFASFRTKQGKAVILNLELGMSVPDWGRLIFQVSDVDGWWSYLEAKGFHPPRPRDASWGERYFHMRDPDGHELSFAQPI